MTTLTGHEIEAARLLALRQMLRLEMLDMSRSKGPTAYSTLKTMGYKGSRQDVFNELTEWRNNLMGETE